MHAQCAQLTHKKKKVVGTILARFLVRLLFFHCMPPGRHSDSTPDSRHVSLCVHDYRAFRTVQAALQTGIAVVSSHKLVRCGNGGGGYAVVERIPSVKLLAHLFHFTCAPSSSRVC